MAKIIEREEQQPSQEDVFAEQEQPQEEEQATTSEPEIPEKYQGKSAKELVQMHQEA